MIARAAVLLSFSLLLGAGSADELTESQVGALKLKTPAAWQRRDVEGTTRFAAPSGEAYFDLDVGQVQRKGGMPAGECLNKILAGLGSEGFTRITAGGNPAAVKETVDTDESGKRFVDRTYVGCNGKTTWSMQFLMVEGKKDRFAPLAAQILKSIEYQR
jgi:hypothetical protein